LGIDRDCAGAHWSLRPV